MHSYGQFEQGLPIRRLNIVPMRKSLNRNVTNPTGKGAFTMERKWANAPKADKKLSVEIEVKYGSDRRPKSFIVNYKIEGIHTRKTFNN
ncbi:DNA/RNA non-specific endonuclease [Flectobacillus roseus]|nr:DNA/RNA non-specific endonuclease [Flectobacillus roseus]